MQNTSQQEFALPKPDSNKFKEQLNARHEMEAILKSHGYYTEIGNPHIVSGIPGVRFILIRLNNNLVGHYNPALDQFTCVSPTFVLWASIMGYSQIKERQHGTLARRP